MEPRSLDDSEFEDLLDLTGDGFDFSHFEWNIEYLLRGINHDEDEFRCFELSAGGVSS